MSVDPKDRETPDMLGTLADQVIDCGLEDCRAAWPQDLADMVDVVAAALARAGEQASDPRRAAIITVLAVAEWRGGHQFYLAKGKRLRDAILHERIYADWGPGCAPRDLASKYKMSEQAIYAILKKQLVLHRKRVQPGLFEEPESNEQDSINSATHERGC